MCFGPEYFLDFLLTRVEPVSVCEQMLSRCKDTTVFCISWPQPPEYLKVHGRSSLTAILPYSKVAVRALVSR